MQSDGGFEPVAPCKGNVSANRMQSDESLLSRAMLRCSLTSPKAMVSQPRVKQAEGLRHPGSPPNVQGLKSIAPCKGNTSSIGATPRRQTTANQTTNVRKSNDKRPQTERKPSVIAKLRPTCNRKIKHKSITIYVIFCDMNLLILQLHNHSNKTHSKP